MTDMELLAPAGNAASLHAAVQSGADAVYLGGPKFNARYSADNFSIADIKKYADYCHAYGVDVHAALNILLKEKELEELADYARELNRAGVDAFIVQDLGAAKIIKQAVPDMPLHASTQMTVTSLEGVKYLEELGFSRVVLARELSEREIENICKHAKAEIEVFVHGAICMCYSGQCLMSSVIGGRSGNRGRCAQPCRLPYELVKDGAVEAKGALLSPKDMALIDELQRLRDIGVYSLKIEGRLKSAEYVSAVVGIYRKYLDHTVPVTKEDMKELEDAFSRSGFTDGYFKGALGKSMMSADSVSKSKINAFSAEAKKRADMNSNIRKIPICILGTLKKDAPLEITMYAQNGGDAKYGLASGTLKSETAVNRPLDSKRLYEQLTKLGETPFEAKDIAIELDDGITIPVKEINAVRRAAAENLLKELSARETGRENDAVFDIRERKITDIELRAEVSSPAQAEAAIRNGIKTIYAPKNIVGDIKKLSDNVNIVTKVSEIFRAGEVLTEGVLVSSPAAARYYRGHEIYGDMGLNVFNSQTANSFDALKSVTLSPELNLGEMRALLKNTDVYAEVIGYGRIPLMIMKNCPVKAAGKCQKNKRLYKLRDRKNEEFPLLCSDGCVMKILNSKPIFTADKIEDLKKLKINAVRLIFTVENPQQCDKIINIYKSALKGEKVFSPKDNTFTRGHYYRGVE